MPERMLGRGRPPAQPDTDEQQDAVEGVHRHSVQALMTQMAQAAVCDRHHVLEQRLCRLLLMRLDRLPGNELVTTQELIAHALGVRREDVSEAVLRLQAAGLVRCTRGHIAVLDRVARATQLRVLCRGQEGMRPAGRSAVERCRAVLEPGAGRRERRSQPRRLRCVARSPARRGRMTHEAWISSRFLGSTARQRTTPTATRPIRPAADGGERKCTPAASLLRRSGSRASTSAPASTRSSCRTG